MLLTSPALISISRGSYHEPTFSSLPAYIRGCDLKRADEADARMEIFRLFYFDVALSTSPTALYGLSQLARPDRILFGSDFPYAPLPVAVRGMKRLDGLLKGEFAPLAALNSENAERLFGGVDKVVARLGGGGGGLGGGRGAKM